MLNALRSLKAPPSVPLFSPSSSYNLTRRTCGIRFQQTAAGNSTPEKMNNRRMDQQSQSKNKPGEESMASFGEGYSTRSEDEGFGGIYGGNQELPKRGEEEDVGHGKAPEFDSTQGSEVKEKETARHQKGSLLED